MVMKKLAAVTAALLAIGGVAFAADFAEIDANADGAITPEEFAAAYPDAGEEVWTATDANGDGSVTEEELQAAMESGILPAG